MTAYWAECAWVGGETARHVLIEIEASRVSRVTSGVSPPPGATRLDGWVVPGLVNTHSHVFHRALRGRVQATGDFWSWRNDMYRLAHRLDPDSLERLAVAAYTEMLAAGITLVGEFHYLHHRPGGGRYHDGNEMSMALVRAAETTGIRLCLLDTCYLAGGFDGHPLEAAQRRFSDGDAEAWAARHRDLAARLADHPLVDVGAAIHSVRAVPPEAMEQVAAEAGTAPLHVHVSEQPAENADCLAATGRTPVALLDDHGILTESTTAIHAVHIDDDDRSRLATAGAGVCVCPTTELDLGDGTVAADLLGEEGVSISLGSDSHAVVDILSEARAVEWNDRARIGSRGIHTPPALWRMATEAGARGLGRRSWGLAEGAPADFAVVAPDSVRTAGVGSIESLLFAVTAADVSATVVGGEMLIQGGQHAGLGSVARLLNDMMDRTWAEA